MSNQLLASSGLIIVTTMIIRMNKAKYAWITAVPGVFMAFVTMDAGYLLLTGLYLPKGMYLLAALAIIIMILMVIVFVGAFQRWVELLQIRPRCGTRLATGSWRWCRNKAAVRPPCLLPRGRLASKAGIAPLRISLKSLAPPTPPP